MAGYATIEKDLMETLRKKSWRSPSMRLVAGVRSNGAKGHYERP